MQQDQRKEAALKAAQNLCSANDCKLLYLTFFGSELYGTSLENSDTDVRGIFLPSLSSIILQQDKKSLHRSSGQNNERNTKNDIDIDLWSVQNWILDLLPAGDTGALDLLFSPSNQKCVIYAHPLLAPVFQNPLRFLDLAGNHAYAQYSLSQAKKYGIKGSRLGALRSVHKWLENTETPGRLKDYLPAIDAVCHHDQYCFCKYLPDGIGLVLCGKVHTGNIKMEEFRQRVNRDMEKYGERAKAAEQNQGLDFKALSHALRALDQIEELLLTKKIVYPLANRDNLIAVKQGKIPWPELEQIICNRLVQIDKLYAQHAPAHVFDEIFAKDFILSCYGVAAAKTEDEIARLIKKELQIIAAKNDVTILYAAEAGSRAWGFPSIDSDYDVRFIYIHPREWYLGAAPERQKDVIETTFTLPSLGVMDVSGWELRKALKIFSSGNPQIAEWLLSPIVYVDKLNLRQMLAANLDACLSQGAMWHHYFGLFNTAMKKIANGNHSGKTLLYAVRPLLILLWLEAGYGPPPVQIDKLMASLPINESLQKDIMQLVQRKKFALERDEHPGNANLIEWINNEWTRLKENPPVLNYKREKPNIDAIFANIITELANTDESRA